MKYFKHLVFILGLSLLVSCGNGGNGASGRGLSDQSQIGFNSDKFFMTTNSSWVSKYKSLKKISLYDLKPELDSLPITKESFWAIMEELKHESHGMFSNYAVIIKGENCNAPLGYCEAHIIDKRVAE